MVTVVTAFTATDIFTVTTGTIVAITGTIGSITVTTVDITGITRDTTASISAGTYMDTSRTMVGTTGDTAIGRTTVDTTSAFAIELSSPVAASAHGEWSRDCPAG